MHANILGDNMTYNPEKAKETQDKTILPPDSIIEATIVVILDGQVRDFVKNMQNWEGDPEQRAIQLHMQSNIGGDIVEVKQVYTYNNDSEGNVLYSPSMNLGKFKQRYGEIPRVGMKVIIITNTKGFGKIKLD